MLDKKGIRIKKINHSYFNFNYSNYKFDDGSHYGIELSSINNFKILDSVIKMAQINNININRVVECRGIFRLPTSEIKEMALLCKEKQIGLILSSSPRAIYDTGGFVKSKNGVRSGYRIRGLNNLYHAFDEILRCIDLGIRGFLIYDEGLLTLLNENKKELPSGIVLKLSVHCGCSNAYAARAFVSLGANTINLIPDLSIEMLSTFRDFVKVPLDIFTDTAIDAGGFIRTYEIPDIIKMLSPVYLKCGPVSQQSQNHLPTDIELSERIKQTVCVTESINRFYPEARQLSVKDRTMAIPQ